MSGLIQFNFLTLFPNKILSYFQEGLPAKAIENNILKINVLNIRDFSNDKWKRVDDTIYGGNPGMLLKVEPIHKALESLGENRGYVVYVSPSGKQFHQGLAKELNESKQIFTFISGYYEGIDHRIVEHLVDVELSLGNYVISSGDLASLCISDAILRLNPGFMGGSETSLLDESHNRVGVLEYPQYTRPADYNGWKVPDVLLNGNHREIELWKENNRKKQPSI
jgi:tRNA (guanine37-N1)-methyltransferase